MGTILSVYGGFIMKQLLLLFTVFSLNAGIWSGLSSIYTKITSGYAKTQVQPVQKQLWQPALVGFKAINTPMPQGVIFRGQVKTELTKPIGIQTDCGSIDHELTDMAVSIMAEIIKNPDNAKMQLLQSMTQISATASAFFGTAFFESTLEAEKFMVLAEKKLNFFKKLALKFDSTLEFSLLDTQLATYKRLLPIFIGYFKKEDFKESNEGKSVIEPCFNTPLLEDQLRQLHGLKQALENKLTQLTELLYPVSQKYLKSEDFDVIKASLPSDEGVQPILDEGVQPTFVEHEFRLAGLTVPDYDFSQVNKILFDHILKTGKDALLINCCIGDEVYLIYLVLLQGMFNSLLKNVDRVLTYNAGLGAGPAL